MQRLKLSCCFRVVFVLLTVALFLGCSGQQSTSIVNGAFSESASPVSRSYTTQGPMAESSADESFESPNPAARPGLATEWGETRYSRIHQERFTRASSSPFATVAIRYNDATGAAHQAAYRQARSNRVQYAGAYGDGIQVSIVDGRGRPLPGYMGGDTMYIVGNHGQRYTVVLTNTTPARFEAVVTIDGLDVINGQPGSMGNRGYLMQPYGTVRIEGFRQSDSHVAAFRFGSVSDSYAAQTGNARNVGVIGVALFAEYGWVPTPVHTYGNEIELRESAHPFPGGYAPPPPRRRYH